VLTASERQEGRWCGTCVASPDGFGQLTDTVDVSVDRNSERSPFEAAVPLQTLHSSHMGAAMRRFSLQSPLNEPHIAVMGSLPTPIGLPMILPPALAAAKAHSSASTVTLAVFGSRGDPCYLATLPRVTALVQKMSSVSANISVRRDPDPKSHASRALAALNATQRLALLATGGADELTAILVRVAKRKIPTIMHMSQHGAGSMTGSHRGGSTIRRSSQSVASLQLGSVKDAPHSAAQSSRGDDTSEYESSDSSSDSDEEEEAFQGSPPADAGLDPASVRDGSASPDARAPNSSTAANNNNTANKTATSPSHSQQKQSEVDLLSSALCVASDNDGPHRVRRESGDVLIVGLTTDEEPFVLEGIGPNTGYCLTYYSYTLPKALRERITLLRSNREDDDLLLCAAVDQTITVDRQRRYRGRSLLVTPSISNALTVVAKPTTSSNNDDDAKSVRSGTGSAKGGLQTYSLPPDEGFLLNDIAYEDDAGSAAGSPKGGQPRRGSLSNSQISRTGSRTSGGRQSVQSMTRRQSSRSPASRAKDEKGAHQHQTLGGGGENTGQDPQHPFDGYEGGPFQDPHSAESRERLQALQDMIKSLLSQSNPCHETLVRKPSADGAEVCFVSDYRRTVGTHFGKGQMWEGLGGNNEAASPSPLQSAAAGIGRMEVLANGNSVRRVLKWKTLYCVRCLAFPRGELTIANDVLQRLLSDLPPAQVTWEEVDTLWQRPTNFVRKEHTVLFPTQFDTHGLPIVATPAPAAAGVGARGEDGEEIAAAGSSTADPTLGRGLGAPTKSSLSKQNLDELQRSQTWKKQDHIATFLQGSSALDSGDGSFRQMPSVLPISGFPSLAPPGGSGAFPGGGARTGPQAAPAAPPVAVSNVEATVYEYLFATHHTKWKLPNLPADTRYLITVCGVFLPEKPVREPSTRSSPQSTHSIALEEGEPIGVNYNRGFLPRQRSWRAPRHPQSRRLPWTHRKEEEEELKKKTTNIVFGSPRSNNRLKPSRTQSFNEPGVNLCAQETLADAEALLETGSGTEPRSIGSSSDSSSDEEHVNSSYVGPRLRWKAWSSPVSLLTNYVPKTVTLQYVTADGFRFDMNEKLCDIEVRNCGDNMTLISHIVASHTAQLLQKYVSAELCCLDDSRYSRNLLTRAGCRQPSTVSLRLGTKIRRTV
jgi:hypothetical protein